MSPSRSVRSRIALVAFASVGFASVAQGTTFNVSWDGAAAGSYNTAVNWSANVVPNNDVIFSDFYNVTINRAGGANVLANIVQIEVLNLTIAAANQLTLADNVTFGVIGANPTGAATVNNAGTIQLGTTAAAASQFNFLGSTTNVTGGGTIVMPGANTQLFGSGTVTSNNTIIGLGNIGADNFALINNGTITASGGSLTIDGRASGGVDNNGLMQALAGGTLVLTGSGGGSFFNTGGTITTAGRVQLVNGANILGGTLNSTTLSTAIFFVPSGNVATLNGLTNNADVNVSLNSTLNLLGTITNNTRVRTNNAAGVATYNIGSGTVTLNGTGTLVLSQFSGAAGNVVGSGTLVNGANHSIFGAGTIGDGSTSIRNDGLIEANLAGQVLNLRAEVSGTNAVVNNGIIRAGAGELRIHNQVQMTNNGTFEVAAGGVMSYDVSSNVNALATTEGTISVAAGGLLRSVGSPGFVLLQNVTLANSGTVEMDDCQWTVNRLTVANNGTINITSDGTLSLLSNGTLTLTGSGRVTLAGTTIGPTGDSATLNNAGNTIVGFGNIGNNALAIINSGTIQAANSNSPGLTIDPGTIHFVNNGTLTDSNGGILTIGSVGGGTFDNSNGTLTSRGGNAIRLNAVISGGTLNSIGGQGFFVNGGANATLVNLFNSAPIGGGGAATITLAGTITNTGTIAVVGGNPQGFNLAVNGTATLTGNGFVKLTGGVDPGQILGSGTLINSSNTIHGVGALGNNAIAIVNNAMIDANGDAGAQMIIDPSPAGLFNTGTIQTSGGGIITLSGVGGGAFNNNGGTIAAMGNQIIVANASLVGGTLNSRLGSSVQLMGVGALADITNLGLLRFIGGSSISVSGTINNAGSIGIDGSDSSGRRFLLDGGTVTLTGGGLVQMGAGLQVPAITGSGTLVNSNNTVAAAFGSALVGDNSISIVNAGTISAATAGATLVVDPSAGLWINSGTMSARNGATLELTGAGGGAQLGNTGGRIIAADASHVRLAGGLIVNGGTLASSGSGSIAILSSATLQNLTTTASLNVGTAATLRISGAVDNSGTLTIDPGTGIGSLILQSGATLDNSGRVHVVDNVAFGARIAGSGTIHNSGTIAGGAGITAGLAEQITITNVGVIEGGANFLDVGSNSPGGTVAVVNSGLLRAKTGGGIHFQVASRLDGAGTIVVENGGSLNISSAFFTAGGPVTLDGTIVNVGAATFGEVSGGGAFGNGLIGAGAGARFTHLRIGGISNQSGTITTIAGGGTLGTSRATGTISIDTSDARWDLTDHDLVLDYVAISPIATVQTLISTGFAAGAWTGNGLTSSVAAAAAATADKTGLGYAEAGELFGGFPQVFSGQTIDSTTVLVKYTLLGDANLSGGVTIADFGALASNFNTTGRWNRGDFNYDLTIGIADFSLLAANFNKTLAAPPARPGTVPEPATGTAAVILAAVGGVRRRRRPRG